MNKNKIKETADAINVASEKEDEITKFVTDIVNQVLEKKLELLVKQKTAHLLTLVESLKAQIYVAQPTQKADCEARINKYSEAADQMMKLNKAINKTNIRSAKIIDALLEKKEIIEKPKKSAKKKKETGKKKWAK